MTCQQNLECEIKVFSFLFLITIFLECECGYLSFCFLIEYLGYILELSSITYFWSSFCLALFLVWLLTKYYSFFQTLPAQFSLSFIIFNFVDKSQQEELCMTAILFYSQNIQEYLNASYIESQTKEKISISQIRKINSLVVYYCLLLLQTKLTWVIVFPKEEIIQIPFI